MLITALPRRFIKLNIFETCAFFFLSFPFIQTEPQQRVVGYSQYLIRMMKNEVFCSVLKLKFNVLSIYSVSEITCVKITQMAESKLTREHFASDYLNDSWLNDQLPYSNNRKKNVYLSWDMNLRYLVLRTGVLPSNY